MEYNNIISRPLFISIFVYEERYKDWLLLLNIREYILLTEKC